MTFAKSFTYVAMRTNEQRRFFDIFGRGPESIPSDHLAALREQWRRETSANGSRVEVKSRVNSFAY